MKRFAFLIVVAVVAMFNSFQAKATDCPPGATLVTRTLNIGICTYHVEICYKCDPAAPNYIKIFGWAKVPSDCDNGLNSNQEYEALCQQVYQASFVNALCEMPGPCDEYPGGFHWTFAEQICWFKMNIDGVIWYFHCNLEDDYCYAGFRLCWDPVKGVFVTLQTSPYEISGNPTCTTSVLSVPDPLPGNSSECFYLQTPCIFP
ncbi:MAG: hypothetical protein NT007_14535 [Candidatus Kapabacteria bacterium]|nr:hypothetical protein [Candidatus Kapabacteria bacterium]